VCAGIDRQLHKELKKPLRWVTSALLRRGTHPVGRQSGTWTFSGLTWAMPNGNETQSMSHLLQSKSGLQQVWQIGFGGLVSMVRSGQREATDLFDPQEMYTVVHGRDTRFGEDREACDDDHGAARRMRKSDGKSEGHETEVEAMVDEIWQSDKEEETSDDETEEYKEELAESERESEDASSVELESEESQEE